MLNTILHGSSIKTRSIAACVALSASGYFIGGCAGNLWQQPWQLEVHTTDHLGNSIAEVTIQLSGVDLGKSDEEGIFRHTLHINGTKPLRLYAHLTSTDYYYAPYIKTFTIANPSTPSNNFLSFLTTSNKDISSNNSQQEQKLTFNAVLHRIPKQTTAKQTSASDHKSQLGKNIRNTTRSPPTPSSQKKQDNVVIAKPITTLPSTLKPTVLYTEQSPKQPQSLDGTVERVTKKTNKASKENQSALPSSIDQKEDRNFPSNDAQPAEHPSDISPPSDRDDIATTSPPPQDPAKIHKPDTNHKKPTAAKKPPPQSKTKIKTTAISPSSKKALKASRKTIQKTGFFLEVLARSPSKQKKHFPLSAVDIYLGYQHSIEKLCVTSHIGTCEFRRLKQNFGRVVTIIAKKKGYRSIIRKVQISPTTQLNMVMQPGNSFDIIALLPQKTSVQGLADAEVWLGQQRLGQTNSFGHFSYTPTSSHPPSLVLTIKSPSAIPSEQTITVNSQDVSILPFALSSPLSHKVVILPPKVPETPHQQASSMTELLNSINRSTIHHFFRQRGFSRIGYSFATNVSQLFGLNELRERGFYNTELEQWTSWLLGTYIYPAQDEGDLPAIIDMNLYNSKGTVIANASSKWRENKTPSNLLELLPSLITSLNSQLTMEAAITKTQTNHAWLNITPSQTEHLSENSLTEPLAPIKVWRWESNPSQRGLLNLSHIANLAPKLGTDNTDDRRIRAEILSSKIPLQPGDLIEIIPPRSPLYNHVTAKSSFHSLAHIRVTSQQRPLKGVMVFKDHTQWIGTTDHKGAFLAHQKMLSKPLHLEFRKPGYKRFEKTITLSAKQEAMVYMERSHSYITIHSKPSGQDVIFNNTSMGKTPLSLNIHNSSLKKSNPPPKLTIGGGDGYKKRHLHLSPSRIFTEYTGARTIILEKDYLSQFFSQNPKDPQKALTILNQILPSHSDYPQAIHLKALTYFQLNQHRTSLSIWKQLFSLKNIARQVALQQSHLYAGLCAFHLAEVQDQQRMFHKSFKLYRDTVRHFKQSAKIGSLPYDLDLKLAYHWALSEHRMALINENKELLQSAQNRWSIFLTMANNNKGKPPPDFQQQLGQAKSYAAEATENLKSLSL
ncbi:MAG: hypothetical protein OXC44_05820 [Proteobacteria bacterium]|nr:hypothetical protein [Pseudomonadota bacterium]